MRELVKEIMRFSGPRLIFERPLLALAHLFDGLRPATLGTTPSGEATPKYKRAKKEIRTKKVSTQ